MMSEERHYWVTGLEGQQDESTSRVRLSRVRVNKQRVSNITVKQRMSEQIDSELMEQGAREQRDALGLPACVYARRLWLLL